MPPRRPREKDAGSAGMCPQAPRHTPRASASRAPWLAWSPGLCERDAVQEVNAPLDDPLMCAHIHHEWRVEDRTF